MSQKELAALLAAYQAGPALLSALLSGLPVERAEARPAPGEWSAGEIAAHLVDGEEAWFRRIELMKDEDRPHLVVYPSPEYSTTSLDESLARFTWLRGEHARVLNALTAAQWKRPGNHERWGEITISWALAHLVAHDSEHLVQLTQRLTPP